MEILIFNLNSLAHFHLNSFFHELCHDRGPFDIETSLLTCSANRWTGFIKIGASVMKDLNVLNFP